MFITHVSLTLNGYFSLSFLFCHKCTIDLRQEQNGFLFNTLFDFRIYTLGQCIKLDYYHKNTYLML